MLVSTKAFSDGPIFQDSIVFFIYWFHGIFNESRTCTRCTTDFSDGCRPGSTVTNSLLTVS